MNPRVPPRDPSSAPPRPLSHHATGLLPFLVVEVVGQARVILEKPRGVGQILKALRPSPARIRSSAEPGPNQVAGLRHPDDPAGDLEDRCSIDEGSGQLSSQVVKTDIEQHAPLPITTGNSYSASGALWTARDALLRLGLLPAPKPGGKIAMKAMVVGATGAIGSVCARLLAMAADEVYMVSPETAKLLAVKESILQDTPDARLFLSSRAPSTCRRARSPGARTSWWSSRARSCSLARCR